MTVKYETRVKTLIVGPVGEKIFAETVTDISIADESGGEFVEVSQDKGSPELGKIQINPEEWPALRAAIDQMIAECRE